MGPVGRVVGIGASAGGVDALVRVVAGLPGDLPHAVCITLHLSASAPSRLPDILGRSCSLPVRAAGHGDPLRGGHVYVAPPDRHLLVTRDRIELSGGPKENGARPAVDTMLRSIAGHHGAAAIAVVLSGALADGSDGARIVLAAGGDVIVQDPRDAIVPGMPERTLALVDGGARVLSAPEIGRAVASLDGASTSLGAGAEPEEPAERPSGPPTGFTCPECSGPIWEVRRGDVVRYRCRVGHEFGEDAMVALQGTAVERALYTALEVLEERADCCAGSPRAGRASRTTRGEASCARQSTRRRARS